jgi:hypothetical protein
MKTSQEIIEKIIEMRSKTFETSTRHTQRQEFVDWVHALEWVIADEKEPLQERLKALGYGDGKNNREATEAE